MGNNTVSEYEHVHDKHITECTCKNAQYIICMLCISLLGIIGFVIFNAIKLKLFKGHLFSNTVKLILFITDAKYYVPLNYVQQLVVYIYSK